MEILLAIGGIIIGLIVLCIFLALCKFMGSFLAHLLNKEETRVIGQIFVFVCFFFPIGWMALIGLVFSINEGE